MHNNTIYEINETDGRLTVKLKGDQFLNTGEYNLFEGDYLTNYYTLYHLVRTLACANIEMTLIADLLKTIRTGNYGLYLKVANNLQEVPFINEYKDYLGIQQPEAVSVGIPVMYHRERCHDIIAINYEKDFWRIIIGCLDDYSGKKTVVYYELSPGSKPYVHIGALRLSGANLPYIGKELALHLYLSGIITLDTCRNIIIQ